MSQCLVCDSRLGVTQRQTYNIFKEHIASKDKTIANVLNEILEKSLPETGLFSNAICKKCHKTCVEYEQMKSRLLEMKTDLLTQFKATLPKHDLEYSTCFDPTTPRASKERQAKRLVLPASKLKPLPANYVINMGNVSGCNVNIPKTASSLLAPSTLSLKVTVGSSVLTQSLTTSSIKTMQKPSTTKTSPYKMPETITSTVTKADNSSSNVISFNVGCLPKNFLASVVTEGDDEGDTDKVMNSEDDETNNDEQTMEIDEDCTVIRVGKDRDTIPIEFTDDNKDNSNDATEKYYIDTPLDSDDGDGELELREVLLSNSDGDEDDTIVMAGGSGSLLRLVGGQRLVYSGGELTLDQGNDSNDESQFELQVSGDEETANAIIAAAQERGGAFIKVESGEMFRVKSVKSKTDVDTKLSETPGTPIVAKEGKLFKCLLCGNNSKDPLSTPYVADAHSVSTHMKTEHDARVYLCQICSKIMRKKSEYIAHTKEHAAKCKKVLSPGDKAPKPHSCTVCKKNFSSRMILSEHMNQHSGRRPYTCGTCHKSFASKYTYQAHLKTHQERPRPFKCSKCPKSFLTQQNLTQHEKTHLGIKEFECNVCGKAFGTQHNLEVHGVVHSGARPFKCTVCPKSFARRAEVRDHARTHTGERPFACDMCGATFAQRSNLHSHKRATHFDDKRHQCAHCPKKFKRRRLLEYHVTSIHTGERPLECEVCHATFVYPEHYKKHLRIHSGERPFVCEVCGKSFNSRDNRNTHRFVHSDKKPYECLVCGAGYMRKQLLYAHMNSSGHIAESIVVNQPRVQKVTEKVTAKPREGPAPLATIKPKLDKLDAIFEPSLEIDNATGSISTDGPKLFITNDKKFILHDGTSITLAEDEEDPALLTMQDAKDSQALIPEADQMGDQAQIVRSADGTVMRLVQIQLDNGTSGWVALGEQL